jgi:hypothetical protein
MSRIRANIKVNGRDWWTLFDTGARNTYVVADVAKNLLSWDMPRTEPAALGGKVHNITRGYMLIGTIKGFWIQTHARILEEIGHDEKDQRIEILFGALAMEEWGIHPVPDEDRLDLTHYPKEFVEFLIV